MRRRSKKIDAAHLEWQGYHNRKQVETYRERLTDFDADPDRKNRLEQHLCRVCMYVNNDRIGGAAFTTTNCGVCDKEMTFGSTCTDAVCPDCAKEYQLCKHCGADINLRVRRKNPKLPQE